MNVSFGASSEIECQDGSIFPLTAHWSVVDSTRPCWTSRAGSIFPLTGDWPCSGSKLRGVMVPEKGLVLSVTCTV